MVPVGKCRCHRSNSHETQADTPTVMTPIEKMYRVTDAAWSEANIEHGTGLQVFIIIHFANLNTLSKLHFSLLMCLTKVAKRVLQTCVHCVWVYSKYTYTSTHTPRTLHLCHSYLHCRVKTGSLLSSFISCHIFYNTDSTCVSLCVIRQVCTKRGCVRIYVF